MIRAPTWEPFELDLEGEVERLGKLASRRREVSIVMFILLVVAIAVGLSYIQKSAQLKQDKTALEQQLVELKRETLPMRAAALGIKAALGKATKAELDAMKLELEAEKKRIEWENHMDNI